MQRAAWRVRTLGVRWLVIAALVSTSTASADLPCHSSECSGFRADALGREMCTSTTRYRGAVRDLDVKDADIRDVFRLLADTGKINIVVSDDVTGRVTMRLKNVPWDQILCTVAAVHKLRVTIDRSIVMVTRRSVTRTR